MNSPIVALLKRVYFLFTVILLFLYNDLYARAGGGGGGHGGGGGGGGFGGGFHGGGGGGFVGGGGGGGSVFLIFIVIVVLVLYFVIKQRSGWAGSNTAGPVDTSITPFPEGLDDQKVTTSFMGVQESWEKKDVKEIRKWISDGVYQRYTAQFDMMNKLSQINHLSNIRIDGIRMAKTTVDGNYQTADVAISFTMDDEFLSDKYPQFNERFPGDSDTEYWTFIKRNDASAGKNLYDNNNCPSCGSPFETKMGEISRCQNCGVLTNNAAFDWVLCEITQEADYNSSPGMEANVELHELTKNDALFAVKRLEDIASNVFMQIMEVFTGASEKKLSRFADAATTAVILQGKSKAGNFVFDRLYLNEATLVGFNKNNDRLNLTFRLTATYQRVQAGQRLTLIDPEPITSRYTLVLSKNLSALQTAAKEIAYSYECPNCAGPYTDTTDDVCPYCGAPVIDLNRNWVLTDFRVG